MTAYTKIHIKQPNSLYLLIDGIEKEERVNIKLKTIRRQLKTHIHNGNKGGWLWGVNLKWANRHLKNV